jgi:hypothetical protein
MMVCVVQLARFRIRTILAVVLTFACLDSGSRSLIRKLNSLIRPC